MGIGVRRVCPNRLHRVAILQTCDMPKVIDYADSVNWQCECSKPVYRYHENWLGRLLVIIVAENNVRMEFPKAIHGSAWGYRHVSVHVPHSSRKCPDEPLGSCVWIEAENSCDQEGREVFAHDDSAKLATRPSGRKAGSPQSSAGLGSFEYPEKVTLQSWAVRSCPGWVDTQGEPSA